MQVRKDKDADKFVLHKTGEGVHEEGEAEDSAPHCHQSGGGPFPGRGLHSASAGSSTAWLKRVSR